MISQKLKNTWGFLDIHFGPTLWVQCRFLCFRLLGVWRRRVKWPRLCEVTVTFLLCHESCAALLAEKDAQEAQKSADQIWSALSLSIFYRQEKQLKYKSIFYLDWRICRIVSAVQYEPYFNKCRHWRSSKLGQFKDTSFDPQSSFSESDLK